jgi:hypothetical protein
LHLIVRGRFAARVESQAGDSVLLDVLGPGGASTQSPTSLRRRSRSTPTSGTDTCFQGLAGIRCGI